MLMSSLSSLFMLSPACISCDVCVCACVCVCVWEEGGESYICVEKEGEVYGFCWRW